MIKCLISKRGSMYIYGAFIIIALVVLASAFLEYFRINGTISKVEQAYEKSMLTVAISNYDEIFTSMRESGQIGGVFDGGNETCKGSMEKPVWLEVNDMGDISDELASLLELEEVDTVLYAWDNSGEWLYSVDNMSMKINQTEGDGTELRYEVEGEFHIELPVYFLGSQIMKLDMDIPSKAVWESKI